MRIAFWVHDCRREVGHGRYVVELASRFRREHEVHVFASTFSPEGLEGVRWHRVPALRRTALTTILSFSGVAALVPVTGFDVVHGQGLCHPRANVVTAHICNAGWFAAQAGRAGGSRTAKMWLFDSVTQPLERRAFQPRPGKQLIAISSKVADELRTFYGVEQPIHVIHHGVDGRTFTPELRRVRGTQVRDALGVGSAECLFLFVGDLRKGADEALRALAETSEGVLALVSGSSDEHWRRLATELGLANRVRFVPATPAVQDYFAAADAFVFPTPYDAFGMVISEAMSSGLPVVTTPAAGAAELIEHGLNGLLVDGRDVLGLAREMRRVAADEALRVRLGTRARERVASLTWDSVARQTLDVYQLATGRRA